MPREDGFSTTMLYSCLFFVVTTVWNIRKLRRQQVQQQGKRCRHRRHLEEEEKGRTTTTTTTAPVVSKRGQDALYPAIPYLNHFLHCLSDQYDAMDNPEGYVALCVAENRLILDLLSERCLDAGVAGNCFRDDVVYCYNSFLGIPIAREAAAYFLANRFLFPELDNMELSVALEHVNPAHVALGAGAAALLNHLFYLLGDEGDACLIPAPYYAAFDSDMDLVAGIEAWPVQQANPVTGPTVAELNLAIQGAVKAGLRPRFLLITNPQNPFGTIYEPDTIKFMVQWARQHNMHTIVDEIYALSTFHDNTNSSSTATTTFQSVIKILNNRLEHDVHMIWAVSKDFGASGLRVGVVYSQNDAFFQGLANKSIFSGVSGPVQYLIAEMLTDDAFLDEFLKESKRRLLNSYDICCRKLDEMVIPYCPAAAGMFVWADFSALLPKRTFEYERRLVDLLFQHAHVVLTPGESQHHCSAGYFRICYAYVDPAVLETALERISKLVAKVRRLEDWTDLNTQEQLQVL